MHGVSDDDVERLRTNRERVLERVARAAERAGRRPESIRLVAVTKTVGKEVVRALARLGQEDFGENRPEVAPAKAMAAAEVRPALRWHMIGHYQSRKIRPTLPYFHLVHSVHSEDLHRRLEQQARALGLTVPVLLQVNVSGEATKQGFSPEAAAAWLDAAGALDRTPLRGFMTMAPFHAEGPELRRLFASLRGLRDRLATAARPLPELSMGMSHDFEEAVLEGATLVRVGSALFEGLSAAAAGSAV